MVRFMVKTRVRLHYSDFTSESLQTSGTMRPKSVCGNNFMIDFISGDIIIYLIEARLFNC